MTRWLLAALLGFMIGVYAPQPEAAQGAGSSPGAMRKAKKKKRPVKKKPVKAAKPARDAAPPPSAAPSVPDSDAKSRIPITPYVPANP